MPGFLPRLPALLACDGAAAVYVRDRDRRREAFAALGGTVVAEVDADMAQASVVRFEAWGRQTFLAGTNDGLAEWIGRNCRFLPSDADGSWPGLGRMLRELARAIGPSTDEGQVGLAEAGGWLWHRGFAEHWRALERNLAAVGVRLREEDGAAGHSLGSAAGQVGATLAGFELWGLASPEPLWLGPQPSGARVLHLCREDDSIARLPGWGFAHVGPVEWLPGSGPPWREGHRLPRLRPKVVGWLAAGAGGRA